MGFVEYDRELASRLESVLVHGVQPVWVELADYDPCWPDCFERCRVRIRRVLGERVRLVEHIGSTSVPGLAAKPVIDIVVGVDDADDEAAYLADLVADGFDLRVREPGHRCLRGSEAGLAVNLHCYAANAVEVERYLRLRDRLRGHEHDRLLYETTKRRLAGRQWPDMNYYAEAKSPVIEEILSRAEAGD